MLRIVVAAALIAAALAAVKQERLLERAGLLGSCSAVAVPGDDGEWRACRPGALSGYPDLSLKDCEPRGARGGVRWWRCPAPIGSGLRTG